MGDAYAFVDPVFSSGVYLAMNSAFAGAAAVDACLSRPASAASALKRFDKVMLRGPREFSWFIYRITKPTLRDIFMTPRNPLRVKEALLSVLAGDIFENPRIWPSVYAFNEVYYLSCLRNLPLSWRGSAVGERSIVMSPAWKPASPIAGPPSLVSSQPDDRAT
ncbi:MAG: hypothetical protein R3E68_08965 [Burkholderiaceae bacterium]